MNKDEFISDWLEKNSESDLNDALEEWKSFVKFVNCFNDWEEQIDYV